MIRVLILWILVGTIVPSSLVHCEEYVGIEFEYMDAVGFHELAAQRLYYRMMVELLGAPQGNNQSENSQGAEITASKTLERLKNLVVEMEKLSVCAHAIDKEVGHLKTLYLQEDALMSTLPLTSNKFLGVTDNGHMHLNDPKTDDEGEGSIFGTMDGIFTVSLTSLTKMKISDDYGRQVAFDQSSRKVYWISQTAKSIKTAELNGTDVETVVEVESYAMAVDSITGNIYFQNATSDDIRVCSRSGEKCSVLLTNQRNVSNIFVHPSKRLMFWIRDTGSVVRASMDGTNAEVILSKQVYSFSVAQDTDRLYWIGLDRQNVYSCDLNGHDETVLLNPNRFHPTAIAVHGDGLYFDRYISHGVTSINRHGMNPIILANTTDFIQHMVVYGRDTFSSSSPCASSPCSHLCVLKLDSFACLCPEGKRLVGDGSTCV